MEKFEQNLNTPDTQSLPRKYVYKYILVGIIICILPLLALFVGFFVAYPHIPKHQTGFSPGELTYGLDLLIYGKYGYFFGHTVTDLTDIFATSISIFIGIMCGVMLWFADIKKWIFTRRILKDLFVVFSILIILSTVFVFYFGYQEGLNYIQSERIQIPL